MLRVVRPTNKAVTATAAMTAAEAVGNTIQVSHTDADGSGTPRNQRRERDAGCPAVLSGCHRKQLTAQKRVWSVKNVVSATACRPTACTRDAVTAPLLVMCHTHQCGDGADLKIAPQTEGCGACPRD
jgi:hypothetical protein